MRLNQLKTMKNILKKSLIIVAAIPLAMCNPIQAIKRAERVTNENRARNYKDFQNDWLYPQGQYRLDFKIGDKFRLNKPMFLRYNVAGIVYLAEPELSGLPTISEYKRNPKPYSFGGDNVLQIIQMAPKGTVIELVAIKDSSQAGFLTYFVFDGKDEWFRCSTFREWKDAWDGYLPDGLRIHPYTYKKEYFTKLPK